MPKQKKIMRRKREKISIQKLCKKRLDRMEKIDLELEHLLKTKRLLDMKIAKSAAG